MNNIPTPEYLDRVKQAYKTTKGVLNVLSDADNTSREARTLRKITTVKQAEELRSFVHDLEDHGIHLILNK